MSQHKKLLASILAAILAYVLSGCSQSNGSSDAKARLFRSEAVKAVSAGLDETHASGAGYLAQKTALEEDRFAFKLYSQLLTKNPDRNIAFSPFAAVSQLYMLYNGSSGATKDTLYDGLGLETFVSEEADNGNAEILSVLKGAGSKAGLSVADSLWTPKGVDFFQPYTVRNKLFYGIDLFNLDYDNPDASSAIDDWFSWRSKGTIDKEGESIEASEGMYLENLAAFSSIWREGLGETRISEADFHPALGDDKLVPMLNKSGQFKYLENDNFTAAALPLGNGQLSMYIFLPNESSSLESFTGMLTLENWVNWMKGFEDASGTVMLPKFVTDSDLDLTSALTEMGINSPFEQGADFSQMTDANIFIKRLRHRSYVNVSEKTAKSTSVGKVAENPDALTVDFTADRPFFYAVKDEKTGIILMMGSQIDI